MSDQNSTTQAYLPEYLPLGALLSKKDVANFWGVSTETVQRRERDDAGRVRRPRRDPVRQPRDWTGQADVRHAKVVDGVTRRINGSPSAAEVTEPMTRL